jgi:glycosyltransferase involved in cell wall biosynthesis
MSRSVGYVAALRLAVYTDYAYHRVGGELRAERAFALFVDRLASRVDHLVLVGRLDPGEARAHYVLGPRVARDFVALPHYETLARPLVALGAMARSLRRVWRALDDVDAVWLLGPHPLALPFALFAALRRRRVVLGVRQDFPGYVRAHRPGRPLLRLAALALEGSYRALARLCDTVVVGPELAYKYRRARRRLQIAVSLVEEHEIVTAEAVAARANANEYAGELALLSVGRLDAEKNPLALVEALALLCEHEGPPRWRLVVCGEGPLADELAAEVERRGLGGRAELLGYVPLDGGLRRLYRESHVLVHSSWTEGLPQVLFEAFAAGLPVVATDVGGIGEAVGEAVCLVPPGDPAALAAAAERIVAEADLRGALVEAGRRLALAHTIDSETSRVAEFLEGRKT